LRLGERTECATVALQETPFRKLPDQVPGQQSKLTCVLRSKSETDGIGTTHMRMHFHVGGHLATGTVNVHMTKRRDESDFKYHHLALDVPGHERIWLENAEAWKLDKRSSGKMFGVRWW